MRSDLLPKVAGFHSREILQTVGEDASAVVLVMDAGHVGYSVRATADELVSAAYLLLRKALDVHAEGGGIPSGGVIAAVDAIGILRAGMDGAAPTITTVPETQQ